jgi:hypothetical protein
MAEPFGELADVGERVVERRDVDVFDRRRPVPTPTGMIHRRNSSTGRARRSDEGSHCWSYLVTSLRFGAS